MTRRLACLLTLLLAATPLAAETWIITQRGQAQKLARELEALGADLVELPQIGVFIARSDEADFAVAAAGLRGVGEIAADAHFTLPDEDVVVGPAWAPAHPSEAEAGGAPQGFAPGGDPLRELQWGHRAIELDAAWALLGERHGEGVRVAVLDTGIDADHPDLEPNIDAAQSRSFIAGEPWQARPGYIFHHGTSVAGVIAAARNGVGIEGVAPHAELVAVKVVSEYTNGGSAAALLQGIVYAAEIGADVINMSLGAGLRLSGGDAALWTAFTRAALYAHHRGATLVASAGNDSLDLDADQDARIVPAQLPHVLTVTSTAPAGWALDPGTELDLFSSYNNYGSTVVDFAAPGGGYHDLGPDAFSQCTVATITSWCISFDFVFTTIGDGWLWANGTSFAAPHVAGVAALLIGQAGGDMHPAQVAARLRRGADDLGIPGKDAFFGHGRLDAFGALR